MASDGRRYLSDLVARRQKYIQRQIALDKGDVNVQVPRPAAARARPANRHGMPKLPVGQHEVKNWPVLDLGEQPGRSTCRRGSSRSAGSSRIPSRSPGTQFLALPQVDDVSDFHCVTTWSRYDNHWRGVRFKTIAELAVPKARARTSCSAPATTSCRARRIPYTTNLPLERAVEDDVLLVHTWEGQPLPREHGGPCRMITPKLYAWKGTKWIRKIEFLAEDRKGFWEVRGYSNSAEPWFNDRYSTK